MAPMEAQVIEEELFEVFMTEWRLQRKDAPLSSVAIIDESPEQQYLYPEFCLYEQLFHRRGIEAAICDPRTFLRKDARLKRNLTLLCAESFLRATGVNDELIGTLLAAVPRTVIVTPGNQETLWASRRDLFFKPAAGYGSKATYRGDKLTKRVWEQMKTGTYVAQSFVAPSERLVAGSQLTTALKVDVRCYAYAGAVKLVAARLYQG